MLTRGELIEELLKTPERIFAAEATLLNSEQVHRQAKEALADREASLLIEGTIDGKNAELRQARLREATESLRAHVEETRAPVEFLRLAAEKEQQQLQVLRSVARLLATEESGLLEVLEQVARLNAAVAQANAELCQHIARIEETQEAHAEALVRLLSREEAPA